MYAQNVDILCTYHLIRAKEEKEQSVLPAEDIRGLTEGAIHVERMTRASRNTEKVRQSEKHRAMLPSLADTSPPLSSAVPCVPHSCSSFSSFPRTASRKMCEDDPLQ